MRTLHLAFLGLVLSISAGAACSGAGAGAGAADTDAFGTGAASGQHYGDWSYPGDGKTAATDAPSSSSSGSGNPSSSGGAGGGASVSSSSSSGTGSVTLDCNYDTTPVRLTLPGARFLASAAVARSVTSTFGRLPDPNVVHATDFLNYYPIKYDEPAAGTLGLSVGVASILGSPNLVLQIGVQAPAHVTRPPLALAVVVDTSLSMAGSSMARARDAAAALAQGLTLGDAFMITTALRADKPQATKLATQGDLDKALSKVKQVDVDGGEDLGGALDDAYTAVNAALYAGAVGRVVLVTDGAAQPTAIDLGVVAGNLQQAQIPLIGVGVGDAIQYDPKFLDVATAVGGGANVFIDDKQGEADSVLHQRFDEIMFSAADDVEVTVSLPSVLRMQSVQQNGQTGSASGLVPVGLGPGRSLIFRQNLETCATLPSQLDDFKINVSVRFKRPGETGYTSIPDVGGTVFELSSTTKPQVAKGDAIAAYADAVAGVRPALFYYASSLTDAALLLNQTDPELTEIQGLLAKDLMILGNPPAN